MFKSNRILFGVIIVTIVIFYCFIYQPSVPNASIQLGNKNYELQAKDYDYSAFGKSNTKKAFVYNSINELKEHLKNEREITVRTNQPITYKNSASTTYVQVAINSVELNKTIRLETEKNVQTIEKPGHYILIYQSEFDVGEIASYYVRINVVEN